MHSAIRRHGACLQRVVNAECIKIQLDRTFPVATRWKRLYAMLYELEADGQIVMGYHTDLANKDHRQYRLASAPPERLRPRKTA